jgi:hypothetical protein
VLNRIHLAFRQFVRPVAPSKEGSSARTGQKPLTHEEREQNPKSDLGAHLSDDNQDRSGSPGLDPVPLVEEKSIQSTASPQTPKKIEFWNPQKLISLLKTLVTIQKISQHHQGGVTYGEMKNKRQSGVQFRKGSVIDRKAG